MIFSPSASPTISFAKRPHPTNLSLVMPVTEQITRLVLTRGTHWTHSEPKDAAVVVVQVAIVRIEVEVPSEARIDRIERTRPVAAERTSKVETHPIAVASGRQEKTVAVSRGEQSSGHAVLRRPYMSSVI